MKPEESFLGQPIRSLQTMLRTIAQVQPNQPMPEADGVYSRATANAVAALQRRNGLSPNGITDQATWEQIVREFEPARIEIEQAQPIQISLNPGQVIRPGEENHLLYLVQSMLITLAELFENLPMPEHTGILDPATEQGLIAFQLQAGLRPTGMLDKQTWRALALHYALAADELSRILEGDRTFL